MVLGLVVSRGKLNYGLSQKPVIFLRVITAPLLGLMEVAPQVQHRMAPDCVAAPEAAAGVQPTLIALTMTFRKVITTPFVMVRSITVLIPQLDAHLRATTGKPLAAVALRKHPS